MARVIVVEDSPVTRQLLAAIVEAAGYDLLAACDNGLSGLQAIQQHRPDLALLDMLLPQLDGIQVLQRLQSLGLSVPVIMLSSVTATDRIQAARAAGVRHYLLKPFDAQKVLATMARVLTPPSPPHEAGPAGHATPSPSASRQELLVPAPNLPPLLASSPPSHHLSTLATPPASPGTAPAQMNQMLGGRIRPFTGPPI